MGRWGIIVVFAIVLAGCVTDRSGVSTEVQGVAVDDTALRARTYALAQPMARTVERIAADLSERTDDPASERAVLQWKANSVPFLIATLHDVDPLAGLIEVAAYLVQLNDFVALLEGAGRITGDDAREVGTGIRELQERVDRLLREIVTDEAIVDQFWARVEDWAVSNPVEFGGVRQPATELYAPLLAARGTSMLRLGADVSAELRSLQGKLDLYAEYAPKMARWNAELVVNDWIASGLVDDLARQIAVGALGTPELPELIAGMLPIDALLGPVQAERELILDWVDGQIAGNQEFIEAQLGTSLDRVSSERALVLETLLAERELILATIVAERELILASVRNLVAERVPAEVERVADGIIWKAFYAGAALIVLAFLAGLVLVLLARRGGRS